MNCWLMFSFLSFVTLSYLFIKKKLSYWSSRGVNGPTPLPLIGNVWEFALKGQTEIEMKWFTKYGKVYGMFFGTKPYLTILDSELIKQVQVKDFNLFVNRVKIRNHHEIWSRNLFNLEDDDWKRVRTITSPSFTAGKLRGMIGAMNLYIDKVMDNLNGVCINEDGVINTKEVVFSFTIDVIAATAFATDTNDRNTKNAVVDNALNLLNLNPLRIILLILTPPKILELLKIPQNFSLEQFSYFRDFLIQVVKQRKEQSGTKHNDLVQLLIDAHVSDVDLNDKNYDKLAASMEDDDNQTEIDNRKNSKNYNKVTKTLDDSEIIAQCILFFVAGFETTATVITYCLFELAHSPDVQDRLVDELDQILCNFKEESAQCSHEESAISRRCCE